MEYSLSLALVDFLPVLFAGLGFMYLIRLVSFILPAQGRIAFLGSSLVLAGGFLKALWKLLMAFSGSVVNIVWMENGLFVLMAPGYIFLAWSIWQTARSVQGKSVYNAWILPTAIITVMFLVSYFLFLANPLSPSWERILLSMMVLATAVTGILLILFAFRLKLYLAAGLFLINLLTIFMLNGMARMAVQSISLQWIEEAINAVCWLAFAWGARMIHQYVRRNFDSDTSSSYRLHRIME